MIIVLLMESEILKMKLMKSLNLKDKFLKLPIIQGGMGIGVSRCRLAGAVAKEGGMGVLSTAQIGYDDPDFTKHPEETNLRVLPEQIRKAKEIAGGNGMVAVNIMAVTQLYETYVKTACAAGVILDYRQLFLMAVATSIDALAVGVSFAFLSVNIGAAVSFIGVITFALSMVGVKVGSLFGAKYKSKAELAGGIILILMGLKILLEHLGVLG